MPRSLLVSWALLTLLSWVAAEPLSDRVMLTVNTFPPSQIYMETPTGESLIAQSGVPTLVKAPMFFDENGNPTGYASGTLVLKADGHKPMRVQMGGEDWKRGYPEEGSYRLVPDSFLIGVLTWVKVYPGRTFVILLLFLGGGFMAIRWRRQAQSTSRKVETLSAQLETSGDPLLGKSIGRYQVEARLGQGGMASVYRVRDDTGIYAAKVIYFDDLDSDLVGRFRREFRLLSQLNHSTFPRCFDYQETDGMAYCIMEFVTGQTLRQRILPEGLPWAQVWPWTKAILAGLECAHKQGIVHRDLKPENIMVAGEQLKILDFGIARQAEVTAITMTGQAFGTPLYVAPEQTFGSNMEVDARTDLYSLGVILFELLSGRPPFEADDAQELVSMHLTAPRPKLEVDGLPEAVGVVIRVLLAKNPSNRYASAQRTLQAFEEAGADVPADPSSTTEIRTPASKQTPPASSTIAIEKKPRSPRSKSDSS